MEKNSLQQQIENMGKEEIKTPFYSKKGYLIEYRTFNKSYSISLLLRTLAFAFDFVVPALIQFLMWKVMNLGFVYSGIVTLIYYHMYYFLTLMILRGRTVGMAIAKRRVVHKSGFGTTMLNYYMRSMVSAVFALPFIGWVFMGINGLSLLLLRGISIVDLISQTIVVSEKQHDELKLIERLEQ